MSAIMNVCMYECISNGCALYRVGCLWNDVVQILLHEIFLWLINYICRCSGLPQ